jgi:ribonuclease HI
VVQQVAKQWNVNQPHLKIYFQEIQDLIKKFDYFNIRHVYRENNKKADALSDETLDKKTSWIRI